MGVFDQYRNEDFPFQFSGQLGIPVLMAGVPTDEKVAEGWIRTKMGIDKEEQIMELVAKTALELGTTDSGELATQANDAMHRNAFKRNSNGLYIEGRQLKAAIKEAISVAIAAGKLDKMGWGKTNKGAMSFLAEHVFVLQDELYLNVTEEPKVKQSFVHTHRGSAIQYTEFVENAVIDFTVISDWDYSDRDWATIWGCGQFQGLGASRSQGYGRYEVTRWDRLDTGAPRAPRGKKK